MDRVDAELAEIEAKMYRRIQRATRRGNRFGINFLEWEFFSGFCCGALLFGAFWLFPDFQGCGPARNVAIPLQHISQIGEKISEI